MQLRKQPTVALALWVSIVYIINYPFICSIHLGMYNYKIVFFRIYHLVAENASETLNVDNCFKKEHVENFVK